MAKKAAQAKEAEKKSEYVIADLEEATGMNPSAIRQKLRSEGIEKEDGRYVWTKKSEFDKIVKLLEGNSKPAAKEEPAKKNGKEVEKSAKGEKAPKNKAASVPETKTEKKRPKPQGARD